MVVVNPNTTALRRWRIEQGLSVRAAARKGGVDPGWFSRVERGLRQPRPAQVARLNRNLGVPLAVLLEDPS